MTRTVLVLLLAAVLTACGSTGGISSRPTPVPYITPPPLTPAPDATAPTPSSTTPPTAPPAAVPAAPAAPTTLSRSFPLLAVGGSFVSGDVQVTERNGAVTATVSARGLPVGGSTLHAVHIHLGSCANPYGGMHLTVLGLLSASGGAGTLVTGLAPAYVSAGHYVIVYSSSAPRVIVGCAGLGSLA